jgi:hypothetical protein
MLLFENRRLVVATMHHKESVIAPLLEKELAVNCFVPDHFDTDILGTFSGEIERKDDTLTTARKKCLMAMGLTNCDLGIASEGSFGPHPNIFIATADDEILILIDKKNNLEIVVRELSLETNFNASKINTYAELQEFANTVQFPSHAILLKSTENEIPVIVKGIQSWELLKESYEKLVSYAFPIEAETDMRALFNPTRMKVIEKATQKLIEKIKSLCPKCKTPGFGIILAKPGLPCEWCKSETESIKSYVYQCQKCQHELEKIFPNNKQFEDPMYCNYCNP